VAASPPQTANRPGVDDLALTGGDEHEPAFRCSGRCKAWPFAVVDDAQQYHPCAEFTAANQRPSASDPVAAVDDLRLPRGAGAVGGGKITGGKHSPSGPPREVGRRPKGIAGPHPPCERRTPPPHPPRNFPRIAPGADKNT